MRGFVKKITWLKRTWLVDFGWGSGYVVIPKGHRLHGIDYYQIHEMIPELEVHGGLTFARSVEDISDWEEILEEDEGGWVIGFDTAHVGDDLSRWPKEMVQQEVDRLIRQLQ